MDTQSPLLTATLVILVVLFVIKEASEFMRKRQDRARRLVAIKSVMAEECKLNRVATKSLREAFALIGQTGGASNFTSTFVKSGLVKFIATGADGTPSSSSILWEPHDQYMAKYLFDAATTGDTFYNAVKAAGDAVANVRRIRDSLIEFTDADARNPAMLEELTRYASHELNAADQKFEALHQWCTGAASPVLATA